MRNWKLFTSFVLVEIVFHLHLAASLSSATSWGNHPLESVVVRSVPDIPQAYEEHFLFLFITTLCIVLSSPFRCCCSVMLMLSSWLSFYCSEASGRLWRCSSPFDKSNCLFCNLNIFRVPRNAMQTVQSEHFYILGKSLGNWKSRIEWKSVLSFRALIHFRFLKVFLLFSTAFSKMLLQRIENVAKHFNQK